MKFTDKNRCGAWRCEGFSCSDYCESDYDCANDLCHVCKNGHKCSSCDNFEDCEAADENMRLQESK